MPRRCYIRIEGEVGITVSFLDEAGHELDVRVERVGGGMVSRGWRLRKPKSPVLMLPESAAVMRWSRMGKELGTMLVAGK